MWILERDAYFSACFLVGPQPVWLIPQGVRTNGMPRLPAISRRSGPPRPVPLPDLVAHANDRNVHDAVEKPLADQLLHRPVAKPLGVKNDDLVPLLFEGVTYVGSAALGGAVLRHSDEALAFVREKGRQRAGVRKLHHPADRTGRSGKDVLHHLVHAGKVYKGVHHHYVTGPKPRRGIGLHPCRRRDHELGNPERQAFHHGCRYGGGSRAAEREYAVEHSRSRSSPAFVAAPSIIKGMIFRSSFISLILSTVAPAARATSSEETLTGTGEGALVPMSMIGRLSRLLDEFFDEEHLLRLRVHGSNDYNGLHAGINLVHSYDEAPQPSSSRIRSGRPPLRSGRVGGGGNDWGRFDDPAF